MPKESKNRLLWLRSQSDRQASASEAVACCLLLKCLLHRFVQAHATVHSREEELCSGLLGCSALHTRHFRVDFYISL